MTMPPPPDEKLCRVCHKPLISHSWSEQKACAEKMTDYYKGDEDGKV
tara:strand:- start:190 stop:330 length:141 start_codon:yes stop_codon:yes gene_type:complete